MPKSKLILWWKRTEPKTVGAIILSVVLLAFFITLILLLVNPPPSCPKKEETVEKAKSVTVFLIDMGNRLSEEGWDILKEKMDEIIREVPRAGFLYIYKATQETQEEEEQGSGNAEGDPKYKYGVERVIHKCSPGKEEEAVFPYDNPRALKRNWENNFKKPIDEALGKIRDELTDEKNFAYWPILDFIQRFAVTRKLNVFADADDQTEKRLVIVSPFVHHREKNDNNPSYIYDMRETRIYDEYQRPTDTFREFRDTFQDFKDNHESYYDRIRLENSELKGVKVTLFMLRALEEEEGIRLPDPRILEDFWTEYFKDAETEVEKVQRIEGIEN